MSHKAVLDGSTRDAECRRAGRRRTPRSSATRCRSRLVRGAFFEAASNAGCMLMPMVLAGFLRIVTQAKVFRNPMPIAEAVDFVGALLALPGATLGAKWERFCCLCREKGPVSNDLPEAWSAAAVLQGGEHLVSVDRGFERLLDRSHFPLLPSTPVR